MRVTANGKTIEIPEQITIQQLLDDLNIEMQEYVSVQLNDEILFREAFEEITITEGSVIEFLYYMGGGSVSLTESLSRRRTPVSAGR
jgi:sulfur carrier protein